MVGSLCFLAISWKHFFFPANIPPGQCPWRKIMPQCPDMSVKFHTRHSLVRPSNRLCPTRILFVTLSGCPMLWKRSHTRFNVLPFFAGFSRKVKRRINLLFSLPALILMPFLKRGWRKGFTPFNLLQPSTLEGTSFLCQRENTAELFQPASGPESNSSSSFNSYAISLRNMTGVKISQQCIF